MIPWFAHVLQYRFVLCDGLAAFLPELRQRHASGDSPSPGFERAGLIETMPGADDFQRDVRKNVLGQRGVADDRLHAGLEHGAMGQHLAEGVLLPQYVRGVHGWSTRFIH